MSRSRMPVRHQPMRQQPVRHQLNTKKFMENRSVEARKFGMLCYNKNKNFKISRS